MLISWRSSLASLILRLAVGGMLLLHGIAKLKGGIGPIEGMLTNAGMPEQLAWGVYLGEIVAPILLILGFLVPLAGLIVVGNMAFAIFLAHQADLTRLSEPGGGWAVELQMLYLVGGLACAILGAGKYSLWYPLSRSFTRRRVDVDPVPDKRHKI
jgi:putative oxidoreductase